MHKHAISNQHGNHLCLQDKDGVRTLKVNGETLESSRFTEEHVVREAFEKLAMPATIEDISKPCR